MKDRNIPQSRDLTIDEAAADLGVEHKLIRRLITEGVLPAYRIKGSRIIRIRRVDLEALKQPIGGAA